MGLPDDSLRTRLLELAGLFLKLGFTAFGGPAAHIAMLRQEAVEKRRWLNDENYLDLIGATNLIPGPNSTEMVLHVGYLRAGLPGLLVAGLCFILPAFTMVLGFAWMYVRYGSTPQAYSLLYGIKPVIISVILAALWSLGKKALRDPLTGLVGAAVFTLSLLGVNELVLLAAGAGLVLLIRLGRDLGQKLYVLLPALIPFWTTDPSGPAVSLSIIFLTFLKIGSVLYGSGYVLLAFLKADLVERLGWLTDQQLIDAIAVGQITPGPVFTTATFVGFLLADLPGALVATGGIFLPAFILVGVTNPLIPRLRDSKWTAALLDGVNAAALGLMASVTWQLGSSALIDPTTVILALVSAVVLFRFRINSAWLVLAGGVIGLFRGFIFSG
jgi:chromate transporter